MDSGRSHNTVRTGAATVRIDRCSNLNHVIAGWLHTRTTGEFSRAFIACHPVRIATAKLFLYKLKLRTPGGAR